MPEPSILDRAAAVGRRGVTESRALGHAYRAGMVGIDRPSRAIAIFRALDRFGQLGGAIAIAAIRHGDRPGLTDERGTLTFAELDARSDALACALRDRGLREGDGVGILCRNHRGFLDSTFGAAKVGARILYLNTDFAGPQLRDVCEREEIALLVHDEEYEALVGSIPRPGSGGCSGGPTASRRRTRSRPRSPRSRAGRHRPRPSRRPSSC